MMLYSVQPRDQIFVRGYGFLSIAKNMSKNLSGKYSQRILDHAKQSATDALKTTSKRVIQKTTKSTSDLTDNKIANKNTEVSKNSQQNNLETVKNEVIKKYLKKDIYLQNKDRKLLIIQD